MSINPQGTNVFLKSIKILFSINDIFAKTMIMNPPMDKFFTNKISKYSLETTKCHEKKNCVEISEMSAKLTKNLFLFCSIVTYEA